MPFAFLAVAGVADEIIANCRRRHTTVWPHIGCSERETGTGRDGKNAMRHLRAQGQSPLAHRDAVNLTGQWKCTAMVHAAAPERDQMTSTVVSGHQVPRTVRSRRSSTVPGRV